MDAYNLSRCVTPTLARSGNLAIDTKIWETPGIPAMSRASSQLTPAQSSAPGNTTLGSIIVHCIQHYFEIFDELPDRTEARSLPPVPSVDETTAGEDGASRLSSSASVNSQFEGASKRDSYMDDEESIDDAMLVMPVGPSAGGSRAGVASGGATAASSPPSAWAPGSGPGVAKYRPRHRTSKSRESKDFTASNSATPAPAPIGTSRSVHTTGGPYSPSVSNGGFTSGRARSTVSVEKGGPFGTAAARKGSIAVGRGTTRKGSGSAVEAIGVTASGFFAPPSNAPPVPSLPK